MQNCALCILHSALAEMPQKIPTFRPPHLPPPGADLRDKNSAQRGYDRRWRKYRKAFLAAHPLCVMCQPAGKITPAVHVDHIVPVQGGQADPGFWDPDNHQGLCHRCHNKKTAAERAGSG
jgi:5-methylcytosine-specific restriction endonuclease McrA